VKLISSHVQRLPGRRINFRIEAETRGKFPYFEIYRGSQLQAAGFVSESEVTSLIPTAKNLIDVDFETPLLAQIRQINRSEPSFTFLGTA
jgi:hypothetical protein